MKKLFIVMIVALLAPVFPATARRVEIASSCRLERNVETDALNIADVLELALCNNPATRGAWLMAQAASASHNRSLSAYFPTLDLNAGVTHDMLGNVFEDNMTTTHAGARLGWLLFDFGGREAAAERTFQTMMSAEFSYNMALQDAAHQALSAFWRVLALKENLAAVQANETATRAAVDLATRKLDLGMASRADRLQAETAHQQARLNITQAEQQLRTAQAGLSRLLGLPATLRLNLEGSEDEAREVALAQTIDELIETALGSRMDLRARLADVRAAESDITRARSGYLPNISAFAANNWMLSNSADPINNHPRENERRLGLQLTWNVFSGFDTTYSVRAARFQASAARENYRFARQSVEFEVVNAYNDYTTGLEMLALARQMVEAATENEAVARGSYQAGRGDIIRLLDAQARLVSAKQQLISARFGLYAYQLALLRATGELFRENIQGIN